MQRGGCMTDVKHEYEDLKKKFKNLPDWSLLNNEFEISTIEKTDFLLRQIKDKIEEKLQWLQETLEKIINPDTSSFADMTEYTVFTETEKRMVLELYRKVVILKRAITEANLLQDDSADVDAIRKALDEWPSLRNESLNFVKKLKTAWHKPGNNKEVLGYLG